MTLKEEYKLLSDNFRSKFATLSAYARLRVEKSILEAFPVGALRNVQLWTRDGRVKRDFISFQTDPILREKRIQFARALLNELPSRRPQKDKHIDLPDVEQGQKLGTYLNDPFVGGTADFSGALDAIHIELDGSLTILYDAYPDELKNVAAVDPNDPYFDDVFIQ